MRLHKKFSDLVTAGQPETRPIILTMPEDILKDPSYALGSDLDFSNAPMTTLKKFEKNAKKRHSAYHLFESKDWSDFDQKLDRLLESPNTDNNKLYIACSEYIKSFSQVQLGDRAEHEDSLLRGLHRISSKGDNAGRTGAGEAIYSANDLVVAFPRISENNVSGSKIHLFYSTDPSTLHEACLRDPYQPSASLQSEQQRPSLGQN